MVHENGIEMVGIEKKYSIVPVLKGVDFKLTIGEIHALLGENGAGKSTLMNILGGITRKNSGKIVCAGKEVLISSPGDARSLGIVFIHQELNLIPTLTVYENIFIGEEYSKNALFLDDRKMIAETRDILFKLGVDLDPLALVSDLTASYKQIVEIGRAIRVNSRIMIMDEPTASLADHEIERLFVIMRSLRATGVGIIFISHKLKEVLAICDTYTVLRDGVVTGNGNVCDTSEEKIVRMMVGKTLMNEVYFHEKKIGEKCLEIDNLTLNPFFEKISFTVRRGEIVGFTGLLGDGRSEVFETIFGYRQPESGTIKIDGKIRNIKCTLDGLNFGLGFLPKNRKENSILWNLSIRENMTISSLKKFIKLLFINKKRENSVVDDYVKDINISLADKENVITSLSGGNQQKVILARWLSADSRILVLDNPTQGIDVGAKSEIYHCLFRLAESGIAVIILSSEIEEIQKICDRVVVMYHGKLAGCVDRRDINEEKIMLYSTGVCNDR